MTLKEFLTNNPEAVKEAAQCKSVKEFQDLAAKVGLTFNSSSDAQKAFDKVKSSSSGELSDDDLDAVNGGMAIIGMDAVQLVTGPDGKQYYSFDETQAQQVTTNALVGTSKKKGKKR